jgi:hypothetical protein
MRVGSDQRSAQGRKRRALNGWQTSAAAGGSSAQSPCAANLSLLLEHWIRARNDVADRNHRVPIRSTIFPSTCRFARRWCALAASASR